MELLNSVRTDVVNLRKKLDYLIQEYFPEKAPYLVCELNAKALMDVVSTLYFNAFQNAVVDISAEGVHIVNQSEDGCFQNTIYLLKHLFVRFGYTAGAQAKFGVELYNFVDRLRSIAIRGDSNAVEFRYFERDMQLLVRSVDSSYPYAYTKIQTFPPGKVSKPLTFEPADKPQSCIMKSAGFKQLVDALYRPDLYIVEIKLQPDTRSLTIKPGDGVIEVEGEGVTFDEHGGLLMEFNCCYHQVSHRYKFVHIHALACRVPTSVTEGQAINKLSIGRDGMLKVQYMVPPCRDVFTEFLVKPVKGF